MWKTEIVALQPRWYEERKKPGYYKVATLCGTGPRFSFLLCYVMRGAHFPHVGVPFL